MRTTITQDSAGYVTLSYDDAFGGRRIRTFFCPPSGGYVRESDSAGRYPQVCDGLAGSGTTLRASSRDALADVIRREYRRMLTQPPTEPEDLPDHDHTFAIPSTRD